MKHSISKKSLLSIALLTIITCWNGSVVDSTDKKTRPETNFYGTLTDYSAEAKVEDIQIGKNYTFAAYQKSSAIKNPTDKKSLDRSALEMDPKENKSILDLHNISKIEAHNQTHPTSSEIEINNRKYIEIDVTFINKNKQRYLIESNKDISCVKVDKGSVSNAIPILEKRKLSMIHVKTLIIDGYRSTKDNASVKHSDRKDSAKAEVAGSTEKILDQLEESVKSLPNQDPSQYEKLKNTMLSLLKSLRHQLQAMLNMLKN